MRELCYLVHVTSRHLALGAASLLVLGLGVYLFFEVRAAPPVAVAIAEPPKPARSAEAPPEAHEATAEAHTEARPARRSKRNPGEGAAGNRLTVTDAPSGGAELARPEDTQKLSAIMDEANKAYDRGDIDEARAIANKALAASPGNTRMLRVLVSSACIAGDNAEAQQAYALLPPGDRAQMQTRCARYGVTFTD